jgi:hypothetical protein
VQYLRCRFAITAACAAGFVAGASADRAGEPLSATPTVETVYLNAQSLEELRTANPDRHARMRRTISRLPPPVRSPRLTLADVSDVLSSRSVRAKWGSRIGPQAVAPCGKPDRSHAQFRSKSERERTQVIASWP